MFCGIGEEERTKLTKKEKEKKGNKRKKKVKKKKKISSRPKVGWLGFFGVLKPFLTETAFYAKLAGRFLGPKTKVTRLIASKFGTNI